MRRTIACLAVALAACGAPAGEVTELAEAPMRIVASGSGGITIDGSAGGSGVRVEHRIAGGDTDVEVSVEGGVLVLDDGCESPDECTVDYAVELDGPVAVEVVAGSGNVSVSGVDGDVTIEVGDGDVYLTNVVGDVEVATGSGKVLATRMTSERGAFATGEGDIDVTFDEQITELAATTEEGNVRAQLADGPYAIDASAPGRIDIRVETSDDAEASVTLSTATGDITVYRR